MSKVSDAQGRGLFSFAASSFYFVEVLSLRSISANP